MPSRRSRASMRLATTNAGMANTIMKAIRRMAHTKSGMRARDMPAGRCRKVVTMISTAATRAATSRKVIMVTQKSMLTPGE
jgi:hypothetical protein